MRSVAILSTIFAAGVLGGVINLENRDVVTHTDIDIVTKVVMVSATGSAPVETAAAPAAVAPAPAAKKHNHKAKHHHKASSTGISTAISISVPTALPTAVPTTLPTAIPTTLPVPTSSVQLPSVPSSTPAPAVSPQDATGYSAVGVQTHNIHRQNNSAPALTWSDDLAQSAAALAAGCVFEHNVSLGPASSYGQNIASSSPATGSTADELQNVISNMWYNGEIDSFSGLFGQADPDMADFDSWGHFTQVVWKSTTQVGCATQNCPSMGYFTVCNYGPAGNYMGEFAENVLPPLGMATVSR